MHLRKISDADNASLRRWRNASRQYFPPAPEITMLAQRRWYEGYLLRPEDHMYLVCTPEPIGTVAINVRDNTIHRVIRGEPGAPGAMESALLMLMDMYNFEYYQLQVLDGNQHAIEFYEDLGFSRCGRSHYSNPEYSLISMRKDWRP